MRIALIAFVDLPVSHCEIMDLQIGKIGLDRGFYIAANGVEHPPVFRFRKWRQSRWCRNHLRHHSTASLTLWKRCSKWKYKQESNFGRDRVVAKRRALASLNASPTSHGSVEAWLLGQESKPDRPATAPARAG